MNSRRTILIVSGGLVAAGYLLAAGFTFSRPLLPVRPFYDGTAPPQPYRWVNPPRELADENQTPDPGRGTVTFADQTSQAEIIVTNDGQALLSVQDGTFKAEAGQMSVQITITPIDPERIGPAPGGLNFDSNAYRFNAIYRPSGSPAVLTADSCPADQQPKVCPTLVLRTARGATDLYRREGGAWIKLEAISVGGSLQIFTDIPRLGTFVTVGHFPSTAPAWPQIARYVALGLAAVAVAAAALIGRSAEARRYVIGYWRKTMRWLRGLPSPASRKRRRRKPTKRRR